AAAAHPAVDDELDLPLAEDRPLLLGPRGPLAARRLAEHVRRDRLHERAVALLAQLAADDDRVEDEDERLGGGRAADLLVGAHDLVDADVDVVVAHALERGPDAARGEQREREREGEPEGEPPNTPRRSSQVGCLVLLGYGMSWFVRAKIHRRRRSI